MLDETIWNNIGNKKFCSFKKKTDTEYLCKNKNNLTGLCNQFSCPLANTKYATIRAVNEELFLFVKEPERIYTPKAQFEKIKLSTDYKKAIEQINKELEYWDDRVIHKCKQKLTKLTEYLQRLEYFKVHGRTEYIKKIKKKVTRAEKLAALAQLENIDFEKQIGEELLLRLQDGVYGDELKDKYHKAQKKEEQKTRNRKKRYVAHFEDGAVDETVANKEESTQANKKKKKEKQKMTW